VPNENFRRELGQTFDDMIEPPSAALRDRVRSSLAHVPEERGPFWVAGVAAAVIAGVVIGVLFVANPLNRPTNTVGPVVGSSPTPASSQSPVASSPSPSPLPTASSQPFVCASPTAFTGQQPPLSAYVDAVRTGSHPGYDRLTIEFQNGQPQSIQLQPQSNATFTRDGIGDTVTLAGNDGLLVAIFSGDAHTAYSGPTDIKTGYSVLLEVRIVGDFEGYVHLGLGLAQPACYRALILGNPTRLVIDIQTS
jgi:hypothetical protein